MTGGTGSTAEVDPDRDTVAVLLTQRDGRPAGRLRRLLEAVATAAGPTR